MRRKHLWGGMVAAVLGFSLVSAPVVLATHDGTDHETFHLCPVGEPCPTASDPVFGLVTTSNPLPSFGIVRSPNFGSFNNFVVAVFVPSGGPALSFGVNFGSASGTSMLAPGGTWTTGSLFDFLGLSQCDGCGPAAPISAFLTGAQMLDPGITGFDVYLVNLGAISFPTTDIFSFTGIGGFPIGSVIYGFATDGMITAACLDGEACPTVQDTTAPSSSILITPEPGTMLLLGSGLLGFGVLLRHRIRP